MTTPDMLAILGAPNRNEVVVSNGLHRDAIRKWLRCQGCLSLKVKYLNYAALSEAVRDETDGLIRDLKLEGPSVSPSVSPPVSPPAPAPVSPPAPAPAAAPTPAPVAAAPSTGNPMDAMAVYIEALVKSALDGNPVGVDEPAVRSIVNDQIGTQLEELQPIIDAMKSETGLTPRLPVIASAASGNVIMKKLAPYYVAGKQSYVFPVMLISPPSFGKSHTVRELGTSYDVYLEHGCSDDIDEVSTLLGSPVPDGAGGFLVVDGVLTEAVRKAAAGETVLLLLDEVLRLSPRAQEWLLTFLTGFKTPKGKVYRLRTRKVSGGALEVIEAPFERLHIVAATNLGMIQPTAAFWSRFTPIRIEWEQSTAKAIATGILKSYGIATPERLAELFAKLIGMTRTAVKEGKLFSPADFRMLENAAGKADHPTAASVAEHIADRLLDTVALWDGDTGDMVPESVECCKPFTASLRRL